MYRATIEADAARINADATSVSLPSLNGVGEDQRGAAAARIVGRLERGAANIEGNGGYAACGGDCGGLVHGHGDLDDIVRIERVVQHGGRSACDSESRAGHGRTHVGHGNGDGFGGRTAQAIKGGDGDVVDVVGSNPVVVRRCLVIGRASKSDGAICVDAELGRIGAAQRVSHAGAAILV